IRTVCAEPGCTNFRPCPRCGSRLGEGSRHDGLGEIDLGVLSLCEARLESVAEAHEFVNLADDAVLFLQRRYRQGPRCEVGIGNTRERCSFSILEQPIPDM